MADRQHPLVVAWIENLNASTTSSPYGDCRRCGFPHSENLLCGGGSVFGSVILGEHTYYIDTSNVDFMIYFVSKLPSNYHHWKNEVFFAVEDGQVLIFRLESYNNCPHWRRWSIPLSEWQTIVDFVQSASEITSVKA